MLTRAVSGVLLCIAFCGLSFLEPSTSTPAAAATVAPATIAVPANYREWIYLTSGLDMTYAAVSAVPTSTTDQHHSVFDNVFVNPEAYRTFKQTGTWPDRTVFVLENRAGEQHVSINKNGRTQGSTISGIELHAKLNNEWVFYARRADGMEHLIDRPADCYTCHEAHAAVDTTFVQFYPTLLPVAEQKQVLSANYKAEVAATPPK